MVGEWYVVGEFHGKQQSSTRGRLGDIRGRPSDEDLRKVKQDTIQLIEAIIKRLVNSTTY